MITNESVERVVRASRIDTSTRRVLDQWYIRTSPAGIFGSFDLSFDLHDQIPTFFSFSSQVIAAD